MARDKNEVTQADREKVKDGERRPELEGPGRVFLKGKKGARP